MDGGTVQGGRGEKGRRDEGKNCPFSGVFSLPGASRPRLGWRGKGQSSCSRTGVLGWGLAERVSPWVEKLKVPLKARTEGGS